MIEKEFETRKMPLEQAPNHVKEMVRLYDAGVLKRGEVRHILTAHDDWCAFYSGKGSVCDCSPDIIDATTGEILNRKEGGQWPDDSKTTRP